MRNQTKKIIENYYSRREKIITAWHLTENKLSVKEMNIKIRRIQMIIERGFNLLYLTENGNAENFETDLLWFKCNNTRSRARCPHC